MKESNVSEETTEVERKVGDTIEQVWPPADAQGHLRYLLFAAQVRQQDTWADKRPQFPTAAKGTPEYDLQMRLSGADQPGGVIVLGSVPDVGFCHGLRPGEGQRRSGQPPGSWRLHGRVDLRRVRQEGRHPRSRAGREVGQRAQPRLECAVTDPSSPRVAAMGADPKRLMWFSCGAASAVTTKLTLAAHDNVDIFYTDPGSEHEDSKRFRLECEQWFGQEIKVIGSKRFADTWAVWESERYLVGPTGAKCTVELKKKPRFAVEQDYEIQVFGYTSEEIHRANRFREQNPEIALETPLIDHGLTKADCLAMVEEAGIKLPAMYLLGYENNNCIGCVKGGMGYWNKIRRDFPPTFARMALLERDIGHSLLSDEGGPVWLDELDPARGRYSDEPKIECSLLCAMASDHMERAT